MWIFKATIIGAVIAIINGQYVADCRVCEDLCLTTPFGFQCRCSRGFHFNPANLTDCLPITANCQLGFYQNPVTRSCEDLDECLIRPCEQVCVNLAGSFRCDCRQGFTRNPQDTTKCIAITSACPQGFIRNPTTGICEAITPTCPPGFYRNPTTGICEATPAPCPQGSIRNPRTGICEVSTSASTSARTSANTADRVAVCQAGFFRNPSTGNCEAQPRTCPSGYVVNPRNASSCLDIDECQTSGLCEHKCINLNGGYRCSCFSEYQVSSADRSSCEQIRKCRESKDMIILIDSTTSMGYQNYKLVLSFVAEVVRHFEFGKTKISVILFSDRVQQLLGFDDYRTENDVTDAILAAPYLGGDTMLDQAFDFVRVNGGFDPVNGGRSNAANEVLIVLDGPSMNPALTRAAAENLKNQDVKIVAVGIGNQVSVPEINSIVSQPEDAIFVPGGFEYLDYAQADVDRRLCPENYD